MINSGTKNFTNSNDDLVTIKNTDDYNSYLRKRDNGEYQTNGISTQ